MQPSLINRESLSGRLASSKSDTQGRFPARPSSIPGRVLSSAGGSHWKVKSAQTLQFLAQKLSKRQSWS